MCVRTCKRKIFKKKLLKREREGLWPNESSRPVHRTLKRPSNIQKKKKKIRICTTRIYDLFIFIFDNQLIQKTNFIIAKREWVRERNKDRENEIE